MVAFTGQAGTETSAPIMRLNRHIYLHNCKTAPEIDGNLNDPAWKDAAKAKLLFLNDKKNSRPEVKSEAYITKDRDNLYIAFLCMEPVMSKITINPKDSDGKIWTDDCVEIFIDSEKNESGYYHLIINSAGIVYDARVSGNFHDRFWNSEAKTAAIRQNDSWTVEAAIPLTKISPRTRNDIWGVNFTRTRKSPANPKITSEVISWAPLTGTFHQPEKFGSLVINDEKLLILDYGFEPVTGKNEFLLDLKNEANVDRKIKVTLKITPSGGKSFSESSDKVLRAGKPEKIRLPFEFKASGKNLLELAINDVSDRQKLLSCFRIPLLIQAGSFKFLLADQLYLPGDKNVLQGRIVLNLTEKSFSDLRLNIFINSNTGTPIFEKRDFISPLKSSNIFSMDIDNLPPGEYICRVDLADKKGNIKFTDCKNFMKLKGF
ncbi:MAG: carbohydrate-binding family 9-like protein [Victivallaceae bacterium]|nr:carbohydrate-binding family 9-like protein [Victivallaceae bacterium]